MGDSLRRLKLRLNFLVAKWFGPCDQMSCRAHAWCIAKVELQIGFGGRSKMILVFGPQLATSGTFVYTFFFYPYRIMGG